MRNRMVVPLSLVFATSVAESERRAFIDAIVEAAWDPERRALTLIALRADFFGHLAPYVELADSILLCPSGAPQALDSSVPAVFCIETLAGLMIQLVGTEVDDRIRQLHDARHASRLEDADVPSPPDALRHRSRLPADLTI